MGSTNRFFGYWGPENCLTCPFCRPDKHDEIRWGIMYGPWQNGGRSHSIPVKWGTQMRTLDFWPRQGKAQYCFFIWRDKQQSKINTQSTVSFFFLGMCVCGVHTYVYLYLPVCVCAHVCKSHGCLWRPKVGIRNPPQSFSTSWIESGSLRWTQSSWASFCGGSPYFCLQNAGITDMLLCPPDMYTCSSPPVCVRSTLMTEPFPSQL